MKKDRILQKIINRNIGIGLLIGMLTNILFADIKLNPNANQNTTIDRSNNGAATIININTPNDKGISVNEFNEFRTKDGVVFNNFDTGIGRSYLAGLMAANPNLSKEQAAKLILNRVGGNNRVEIENYLEVMSNGKTDMIMSSPNGFYLNNTGFINFRDVAFTTANVNLDANGNLMPFGIRGGDIQIGRQGINAEGLRYLALLSQKINIDGQINGTGADVDLIAGNFDYNPNTKDYTNQGVNNNELLISSSAFGSIYGSQIKIVASNGNVGVMGDVISERVLRINADGTIVTNKTQSKESTEIKGKEYTQTASTYTEGNLTIEADKATLKGNGTQAGNILITGDLENEVNIHSLNDINVGKGLLNKSGQIVAERNISINEKVDNKDLLYAKNSITIGKELNNTGNIQSNGSIKTGGNAVNIGKILSEEELKIDGKLTSTGTVYGKNKIEIKNELDNSGDLQSEGNITAGNTKNTGRIISDKNIEISGNIETEETVYAKENLTVKGNLTNKNDIQAEGNITVTENTNNSGKIISDRNLDIKGKADNTGTLYGNESVSIGKDLNSSGNIQSTGDIKAENTINTGKVISEKNITTKNLDNSGEITANKQITVSNIDNKTTGKLSAGDTITANGNTVNQGSIRTNGSFNISGNFTNYNETLTGGNLTSKDISNSGILKVSEKIIARGNTFTNTGNILVTNLDTDVLGAVTNTNQIIVLDGTRIKSSSINNSGYISSTNLELQSG